MGAADCCILMLHGLTKDTAWSMILGMAVIGVVITIPLLLLVNIEVSWMCLGTFDFYLTMFFAAGFCVCFAFIHNGYIIVRVGLIQ